MTESFERSGRLEPEEAREFISNLCRYMSIRGYDEENDEQRDQANIGTPPESEEANEISPAQRLYGDTWTFLLGISQGLQEMYKSQSSYWDEDAGEWKDSGYHEDHWQEHYDQYGYGAYGRGLKIGKRLAFYDEEKFSFIDPEAPAGDETDAEPEFTFVE